MQVLEYNQISNETNMSDAQQLLHDLKNFISNIEDMKKNPGEARTMCNVSWEPSCHP